jgi:ABC-type nitrate/sulfonate/bicarbonate transport system substrate-binding protein
MCLSSRLRLPVALALLLAGCNGAEKPSHREAGAASPETTFIRIAGTPHQDTTQYMWGIKHDVFRRRGVTLEVRDTTWNDQLELAAGGGCDMSMATPDELAAKSRSLTTANRRVVYIMPAWLFEGQIFVSRPEIRSLAEFRKELPESDARRAFFHQLSGRKIAVPEGSSYDQALRKLMKDSGLDPKTFQFVPSELEVGINGLKDRDVAIAAAGIVERPQAERQGYKIALDSLDLEMIVVAGFICNAKFYEAHTSAVDAFLMGWFESVAGGLGNPQEQYETFKSYVSQRGGKVPTFDEYQGALKYTRFSRTPQEVYTTFLDPSSRSFWRKPWDQRIETLRASQQGNQVPLSTADFIADAVVKRLGSK